MKNEEVVKIHVRKHPTGPSITVVFTWEDNSKFAVIDLIDPQFWPLIAKGIETAEKALIERGLIEPPAQAVIDLDRLMGGPHHRRVS